MWDILARNLSQRRWRPGGKGGKGNRSEGRVGCYGWGTRGNKLIRTDRSTRSCSNRGCCRPPKKCCASVPPLRSGSPIP